MGVITNPHFKVVMIFVGGSRMFGFDEEKPIKFSFGGILYLLYTIHQINITLTHFQKMTKQPVSIYFLLNYNNSVHKYLSFQFLNGLSNFLV